MYATSAITLKYYFGIRAGSVCTAQVLQGQLEVQRVLAVACSHVWLAAVGALVALAAG